MPEQTDSPAQGEPTPNRPRMPDGYGLPADSAGMLAWRQVCDLLERALLYWVGTTRPDGRPHASPIWGVWVDNCFDFKGAPETRRGRNLAANPAVSVHLELDEAVVMVDGTAAEIASPDAALAARLVETFAAKYEPKFQYRPDPAGWDAGGLYVVRPHVVLAWHHFLKDAGRWQFGAVS